jgi:M6 family metalloprotease-like protein
MIVSVLGALAFAMWTATGAGAAVEGPATQIRIGSAQCHGDRCFLSLHLVSPGPALAVVRTRGDTHSLKVAQGRSTRVVALPRRSLDGPVRVRMGGVDEQRAVSVRDLPVNSAGSPCAALDPTDAYLSVGPTSPHDAQSSLPSTGTLHAAVIFADFPDLPGSGDPVRHHRSWLAEGIGFTKTSSYGNLDVSLSATTPGWVRLPKSASAYGISDGYTYEEHQAYLQDAIDAADSAIDFGGIDMVLLFVPPGEALTRSAAFRGLPDSLNTAEGPLHAAVTFGSDATTVDGVTFSHELAHLLGLPDLYAIPETNLNRFVGTWDYMGSIFTPQTDLVAWQRLKLGWIPPGQVLCARPGATTAVRLGPLARRGVRTKAVFVRTGPTTGLVVENRQRLSSDSSICQAGALVYTVDSSVATGRGPIRVRGGTRPGCGSGALSDATLGPGEHLRVNGVRISVVGTAGHAVEVLVRR